MNRNKIDRMIKGAMIAALYGVFGVINIYTGSTLDIVFSYVLTIFMTWYTLKYDYKYGLLVNIAGSIIAFIVGNLFFTLYTLFTVMLGIYLGYSLKNQYNNQKITWHLRIISLLKNCLIFFVLGSILQLDAYMETLEIYNSIPIISQFMSPKVLFVLLILLLTYSEAYIVRWYSHLFINRISKINK